MLFSMYPIIKFYSVERKNLRMNIVRSFEPQYENLVYNSNSNNNDRFTREKKNANEEAEENEYIQSTKFIHKHAITRFGTESLQRVSFIRSPLPSIVLTRHKTTSSLCVSSFIKKKTTSKATTIAKNETKKYIL